MKARAPVMIIAEAGVNHNGDIRLAKEMIDAASEAKADAVKFQTFRAENLVIRSAPKARYQIENTGSGESQFDMLKKLELAEDDLAELFSYCARKKVLFMSTAVDVTGIDILESLGVKIFKLASCDVTNMPLLRYTASKRKPIILSTGMSYMEEVKMAAGSILNTWKAGKWAGELTLLHCVSDYPPAMEDVNLLAMVEMKKALELPVGYSDHTVSPETAIAAVALGATVIEKHFTLDKRMAGPDHRASLEPGELKMMVDSIRNVELALGDGVKRPLHSEVENRAVIRKSIVARRNIKKGEIFSEGNITVKRPGIGIDPMKWDKVIGKAAPKDFAEDTLIEL